MSTIAKTIYLQGCNYELQYDILSQSAVNNTTTVRFYGVLNVTNAYVNWDTSKKVWVHYAETSNFNTYYSRGSHTLVQGDFTFTHNTDGTKTQNIGFGINTSFINGSDAVDITFPKIDRYAYITDTVQNPNDESTIWFKYDNPLNLEIGAWLEVNPNGTHYATRTITNAGTSGTYTWELTTEERNQLRSELSNANNGTLRIGVYSSISSVLGYSYRDLPFSIVNADPTLTHTEEEINSDVISLLGSSGNTVIQNVSILRTTVTPTAYKEATISYVKLNSLDYTNTITSSPYIFDVPVRNNSFAGVVVDSRGNGKAFAFVKTLIEYKPVDITNLSMKRVNPTSSDIKLNLEATYYQKTFGSTANVPVVKWKLDDGSYTTIPSTNYTIDTTNNKLTITNYTLSNVLSYQNQGQFTLYIEDLLTNDTEGGEKGKILKGIPTFDAGEHNFKVNGDLYIADTSGDNKVSVLNQLDFKIEKFESSITVGGNSMTSVDMGNLSIPSGYTFLGVVANSNGYGDQWLVSYSKYSNKIQAVVHSKYSSSLTGDLICYAIYLKTDFYNDILVI